MCVFVTDPLAWRLVAAIAAMSDVVLMGDNMTIKYVRALCSFYRTVKPN